MYISLLATNVCESTINFPFCSNFIALHVCTFYGHACTRVKHIGTEYMHGSL